MKKKEVKKKESNKIKKTEINKMSETGFLDKKSLNESNKSKNSLNQGNQGEKVLKTLKTEEDFSLGDFNFYYEAISEIFSKIFLKAILVFVFPFIPVFIIQKLVFDDFFYDKFGLSFFSFWSIFIISITLLFTLIAFLFGGTAVLFLIRDYQKNLSLEELFYFSRRALIGVLFLGFVTWLFSVIGFVIFFIPGILFYSFLTFSKWFYITKESNVFGAIGGGISLVADHFWAVFVRIASFLIVSLFLSKMFDFFFSSELFFNVLKKSLSLTWFLVFLIFEYIIYLELVDIKKRSNLKESVSEQN